MLLPDRSFNSQTISGETRSRIMLADYFILFSTGKMSKVVKDEIDIAFAKLHDKSKILVIYDQSVGKNLPASDEYTSVFIDTREDPLKIVTEITKKIQSVPSKKSSDNLLSSLGGILMIGLGLFALNEIFSEDQKPKPRKKIDKRKASKRKASY
jgi:hypothetical protein